MTVGDHPWWFLLLPILLCWQGWMMLGLFGARDVLDPLLDDTPILSGRHPLHLYHGYLGARTLFQRGSLSCYDPAFFAGYPKTPVFDSGSRPAELILALAGGKYQPAVYKIFLMTFGTLLPLLFWLAARGAGLTRSRSVLVVVLALGVWWGRPAQEAFLAGEVDLLLATVLVVVQGGLLIRYHERPCFLSWLCVVMAGLFGWLAHPLLMTLLLPLFLIYYITVGVRHPLGWHLALLGGLLAAIAVNGFWLLDWIDYWWLRVPLRLETPVLTHRTFRTLWNAWLWGQPADRTLVCLLIGAALAGVLLLNQTGQRPAARMFGLGAGVFLVLAVIAVAWEPMGRLGAARLLLPGLWLACIPAAHALGAVLALATRWAGPGGGLSALLGSVLLSWLMVPGHCCVWRDRLHAVEPLEIGWNSAGRNLLRTLRTQTTPTARILWEDIRKDRKASHWSVLLPKLTERSFIGGLDPDAGIEHTSVGLCDQLLAGRALRDWSDDELEAYCNRYNIGWVVCWSQAAQARFRDWSSAEPTATLAGETAGQLFTIRRPHSFALTGAVGMVTADTNRVVLSNLTPDQGKIVLCLHYQAGLRVSPARVRLEPELDPHDPIPLVRLLVDQPVARVTLTWERP